jgi:hypothetical protein
VVTKKSVELPTTIDGAVRLMLGLVPEEDQSRIAYMSEDDLLGLHMGLGQWVRNHLGLWGGNTALMAAIGENNADDASAVIVRAFWEHLRNGLPKMH